MFFTFWMLQVTAARARGDRKAFGEERAAPAEVVADGVSPSSLGTSQVSEEASAAVSMTTMAGLALTQGGVP